MTNDNKNKNIGRIIKQRRLMIPLTLRELAAISGVSSSHLGRVERGERFPSASILRKIAHLMIYYFALGYEPKTFTKSEVLSKFSRAS